MFYIIYLFYFTITYTIAKIEYLLFIVSVKQYHLYNLINFKGFIDDSTCYIFYL
ncbi:hypothetical protein PPBDW_II0759 [Photobacterium kishitanii]|nr:hypothetical protein PPBDW_II0759 [Photobacterium kishitanii]